MRILYAVLLFLTCSASAEPLPAADAKKLWDQSLKLYTAGDFERSRNLLLYLVKAKPANALYWFNLGNSYFMLEQFRYAETCFKKVESLGSHLAPAAALYRSKALSALGDKEAAKILLQQLLQSKKLTKSLAQDANRDLLVLNSSAPVEDGVAGEAFRLYREGRFRRALRVIEKSKVQDDNLKMLKAMILIKLDREDSAHEILSRLDGDLARSLIERIRNTYSKPKWVFIETAAGHDSNVYGANDATAAGVWSVQAGGGGRFISKGLWYGSGGYSGRYREVLSYSDLRMVQHEGRLNFGREVAGDLVALSPYILHETLGGNARRFVSGTTARARTTWKGVEFGFEGEWTAQRSLDRDESYLTGSGQNYSLYTGWVHNPVYLRANIMLGRLDVGDQDLGSGALLPYAHHSRGGGGTVLWRVRTDWAVEFSAAYTLRIYPTPPSSGPKREDREWSWTTRVTKTFSPELSLYSSLTSTDNESTLNSTAVSNESYSQLQIMAGVIWDAI